MGKTKWSSIVGNRCITYKRDDGEPELLHIIITGNADKYIVVWEDAFDDLTGHSEIMSSTEIYKRFNIDINI